MTKAEKTRELIIEKTAPLFNKKGFDGTTLSDLTNATGLTKGALYGHFSDKEDIATEAFKFAIRKVKSIAQSRVDRGKTYKQRLAYLLEFYAEYVMNPPVAGGCPLLNSAVEADDNRPGMRRIVVEELNSTIRFMTSLIKEGIKNGEFIESVNARELAYVFFCSVEGALMYARVERSNEPMKIVVNHCKKMLDQISK